MQWLADECRRQAERAGELIVKLRDQRRQGEIDQADFESEERRLLTSEDSWQGHRTDLEAAYDERLKAAVASLPRTRRDELSPRIHLRVERALQSPQQRAAWTAEHWSDGQMTWTV